MRTRRSTTEAESSHLSAWAVWPTLYLRATRGSITGLQISEAASLHTEDQKPSDINKTMIFSEMFFFQAKKKSEIIEKKFWIIFPLGDFSHSEPASHMKRKPVEKNNRIFKKIYFLLSLLNFSEAAAGNWQAAGWEPGQLSLVNTSSEQIHHTTKSSSHRESFSGRFSLSVDFKIFWITGELNHQPQKFRAVVYQPEPSDRSDELGLSEIFTLSSGHHHISWTGATQGSIPQPQILEAFLKKHTVSNFFPSRLKTTGEKNYLDLENASPEEEHCYFSLRTFCRKMLKGRNQKILVWLIFVLFFVF